MRSEIVLHSGFSFLGKIPSCTRYHTGCANCGARSQRAAAAPLPPRRPAITTRPVPYRSGTACFLMYSSIRESRPPAPGPM